MNLVEVLVLFVVAGVCGSIGQSLSGFTRGGCLASIALGFVGALLGTWIARSLELPTVLTVDIGGSNFPVVWSIVGSALFVTVVGIVSKKSRDSK